MATRKRTTKKPAAKAKRTTKSDPLRAEVNRLVESGHLRIVNSRGGGVGLALGPAAGGYLICDRIADPKASDIETGFGEHRTDAMRYAVAGPSGPEKPLRAMEPKPSRPGVRGQLDTAVRLTAQIGEALDGLAAVLDPVLGGPTPMAEAETTPVFDSSLQQEVAEHNERLEALLSRVRSLVDRVRV